jgi:hypothetical protein
VVVKQACQVCRCHPETPRDLGDGDRLGHVAFEELNRPVYVDVVVVSSDGASGPPCSRRRNHPARIRLRSPGSIAGDRISGDVAPLGDDVPEERLEHVDRRRVAVGARVGVAAGELLEEDPMAKPDVPRERPLKRSSPYLLPEGIVRIEGKEHGVVRDRPVKLSGNYRMNKLRRGEKEGSVTHPVPVATVFEASIAAQEIVKFELRCRVEVPAGMPPHELGRFELVYEDDVDDLHPGSISNIDT